MKLRHIFVALCLLLSLTVMAAAAEETGTFQILTADATLSLNGEHISVDLAGHDLTVTGTGTVSVIDTANDTYDEAACGAVICGDTVQVATQATAPNGNRYVTIEKDGTFSAHRLEMELTHVTLRTAGADLSKGFSSTVTIDGGVISGGH